MSRAVIGIGTNMGDRKSNIELAVDSLNKIPVTSVCRVSSLYETKPWGYAEQENFYNIAAEIETGLSPAAILGACLGIEAGMGRIRQFKNGPRIIDLDLLFYESQKINTPELSLPHPLIGERDFVLVPLKELFPDLNIFGFDYSENYRKIHNENAVFKV